MSLATDLIPVGLELARLGIEAAQGHRTSPENIARELIDLGLQIATVEDLSRYLTEAGVARAEAAADVAEAIKFRNER